MISVQSYSNLNVFFKETIFTTLNNLTLCYAVLMNYGLMWASGYMVRCQIVLILPIGGVKSTHNWN